jgi:dihydrofolate reductase
MPFADRLILTLVHTTLDGEVFFPAVSPDDWRETESLAHPADAEHAYAFTIRWFDRRHS